MALKGLHVPAHGGSKLSSGLGLNLLLLIQGVELVVNKMEGVFTPSSVVLLHQENVVRAPPGNTPNVTAPVKSPPGQTF